MKAIDIVWTHELLFHSLNLSASQILLVTCHSSLVTSLVVEQEIDSFIRFLATERGLSDNYQLSTRRSLTEFAEWCSSAKKITAVHEVTQPVISEYLSLRKQGGLAAASIKLIVVALKIFFRFLSGKGALERDPTETLTLPRIERYLPETLNELQVERLIDSIDTKQPLGLRNRAMVELLHASGLRISELANARLENLNSEERILRVTGKGNKMRLVPVGRKACEALASYISTERPTLVKRRTSSEIFLSRRGTKLTTARIWQVVKKCAKHSGLETNIIPTSCATASRRICSATALICESSRKCSATPTFLRRRFTPTWTSSG